ncbi:GNAT family N-acetyltransferase [Streptomyces sp. NPDC093109]|uniref:GNAT family N-acetyltransferase n=1 Tax=Streptomyces sp. NPDC093109 TaxID=3154977 RepID=UPI00344BA4DE
MVKFTIRPARAEDSDAVRDIVLARSTWLEERGLPSWRADVDLVSTQTTNPDGAMYVLEADGRPVGCTTVTDTTPPMAWTEEELAEPSLYLYTTITHPETARLKPGTLIALWAVDRAAREGKLWVRRGCRFPGLVTYYERQNFTVVHTMQKTHGPMYLMARRAERIDDLEDRFNGPPRSRVKLP